MGWFEQFFGLADSGKERDPDYSATMEKIEESLADIPVIEARYLACVALLAARVANIDHEISPGERARILDVLCKEMKLPGERAEAVMKIAIASEESATVEFHLVTRRLNELASRAQKLELLRILFHVAAHDDITEQESDNIGAVASALLLPRADFLAVRAEFREQRKIFKEMPKG
jgi:uncharacterized tellurite resistance protein B-like protein